MRSSPDSLGPSGGSLDFPWARFRSGLDAAADLFFAAKAAELRAWLLELRERLAPESIAGYVRGLKAFGNWCAAEEVAAAGGFRGLRRPKVPRRLIAPFSDPELRSLLALADERERALALVLLDTGLRLSELASLRVGDVRPDGTLHVMGKGAKERIVPIGASARRALVRYLATRPAVAPGDPLFCGRWGPALVRSPTKLHPRQLAGRDRALLALVSIRHASYLTRVRMAGEPRRTVHGARSSRR